jgi:hypothetical protein
VSAYTSAHVGVSNQFRGAWAQTWTQQEGWEAGQQKRTTHGR